MWSWNATWASYKCKCAYKWKLMLVVALLCQVLWIYQLPTNRRCKEEAPNTPCPLVPFLLLAEKLQLLFQCCKHTRLLETVWGLSAEDFAERCAGESSFPFIKLSAGKSVIKNFPWNTSDFQVEYFKSSKMKFIFLKYSWEFVWRWRPWVSLLCLNHLITQKAQVLMPGRY